MSIEENKRTALKFLKSMETETDYSLAHEDMRWWIPGVGKIDRTQFEQLMARVRPLLKTPVYLTVDHVTAEDDRVAVECRGRAEMQDGRFYENTYHFLYILRDGKIIEQREHANSAYARAFLGDGLTDGLA